MELDIAAESIVCGGIEYGEVLISVYFALDIIMSSLTESVK